jgi:DNA repair protein RadC
MDEQAIINQAMKILKKRFSKAALTIKNVNDVKSYLKLRFSGLEHEAFDVMFLNSQHGLIAQRQLFRGTIDKAAIYPREIVKATLEFNAAAVILAHNHPSGNCEPSAADRQITKRISDALGLIDVKVLDHVIVGGGDSCSFAQRGLI